MHFECFLNISRIIFIVCYDDHFQGIDELVPMFSSVIVNKS